DGEPLHPALRPEPGDVREVQRQAHQGAQHRQRQLLLPGEASGALDLLGGAVEQTAVLKDLANMSPGAGAGTPGGTGVDQRLVPRQLLLQQRREPARRTDPHALALTPGSRTVQAKPRWELPEERAARPAVTSPP